MSALFDQVVQITKAHAFDTMREIADEAMRELAKLRAENRALRLRIEQLEAALNDKRTPAS